MLQQRRLRYFGHVSRMGPDKYPYVLLHGKVHGTRPVSRPRKKWLDNIRDDCVDMGTTIIETTQWTADHSGDVSSTPWAANTRQRLRPNGRKLSKSTQCVSAVFAVARYPSVCLSVTLMRCIHTAEDIVKPLCWTGNPFILVFFLTRAPVPNSKANPFSGGAKYTGWGNFVIFDGNHRLSRKRYEI